MLFADLKKSLKSAFGNHFSMDIACIETVRMQFGCLMSKNSLECFVIQAKSKQYFNGLTFLFLPDTKLYDYGVCHCVPTHSIGVDVIYKFYDHKIILL